jgi:hypothetical protein
LSTTNPTWTHPESNPGLRGERPVTNRLSHGMAGRNVTLHDFFHTLFSSVMTFHAHLVQCRCINSILDSNSSQLVLLLSHYISAQSPQQLRHLSYRGTTYLLYSLFISERVLYYQPSCNYFTSR